MRPVVPVSVRSRRARARAARRALRDRRRAGREPDRLLAGGGRGPRARSRLAGGGGASGDGGRGRQSARDRPGVCPWRVDRLAPRHGPAWGQVRRRPRRRRRDRGGRGRRARIGRRLPRRGAGLQRAFLEVHVEQGPRLAGAGAPLGIVTGVVGVSRGTVVVNGRAGHAGTTPMDVRDDALVKAAELMLRMREVARSIDGAVVTVGELEVEPGAVNVIPSRVTMSVDARAPTAESCTALVERLGFEPTYRTQPAEID